MGARARGDGPSLAVATTVHATGSECGAQVTDPADLVYCGAKGTRAGGQAYEFDGPDDVFTNFGLPVDNTDGHRMYFGALVTTGPGGENVYHSYFLAMPKGSAIKIVDLVDDPPEAVDFRIEGATVRTINATGATLATYQVVGESLVPSASPAE